MAILTSTANPSAQGIIQIFTFASIDTGDTFTGPSSPKAYWASMNSVPTTQASAGASVEESSGTYTFYPGEDGEKGFLFVIE